MSEPAPPPTGSQDRAHDAGEARPSGAGGLPPIGRGGARTADPGGDRSTGPGEDRTAARPGQRRINSGPGRALVAVYILFAIAATSRATVQIATKFSEAPVAYLLSALAAVIYIVATVGLARGDAVGRRTAVICCSVEFAGVLAVGALSLLDPALFPDDTVWSDFGGGYGYVPLVLPVVGLLWLRRTRSDAASPTPGDTA